MTTLFTSPGPSGGFTSRPRQSTTAAGEANRKPPKVTAPWWVHKIERKEIQKNIFFRGSRLRFAWKARSSWQLIHLLLQHLAVYVQSLGLEPCHCWSCRVHIWLLIVAPHFVVWGHEAVATRHRQRMDGPYFSEPSCTMTNNHEPSLVAIAINQNLPSNANTNHHWFLATIISRSSTLYQQTISNFPSLPGLSHQPRHLRVLQPVSSVKCPAFWNLEARMLGTAQPWQVWPSNPAPAVGCIAVAWNGGAKPLRKAWTWRSARSSCEAKTCLTLRYFMENHQLLVVNLWFLHWTSWMLWLASNAVFWSGVFYLTIQEVARLRLRLMLVHTKNGYSILFVNYSLIMVN